MRLSNRGGWSGARPSAVPLVAWLRPGRALARRSERRYSFAISRSAFLRTSTVRRSCIAKQERVGHRLEIGVGGAGLGPMGGEVQVIDGAQDVVDIARRQQRLALGDPGVDGGPVFARKFPVAVRFDLAVADVDDRDLVHLDPPVPVLGVHAVGDRAVFADPEVIVGEGSGHRVPALGSAQPWQARPRVREQLTPGSADPQARRGHFSPAVNAWIRLQASSSAASEVA